MRRRFLPAFYLFILPLALSANAQTDADVSLQVTHLRCEYRTDPLGIDILQPRLSWVLQSSVRGQKQTAYRVLVADNRASLDQNEGNLWDSGKVESDETIHILYQGKPMTSRTHCYWKVCAWDKEGQQSPWSEVASWSMGLLQPSDWSAEWIADAKTTKGTDTQRWPGVMMRKEFALEQNIKRATVHITAKGLYELRINGQRTGDHILAPEWTDYHKRVQVQTYDVTELLQKGDNAIGVILGEGWYAGRVGMAPAPHCKVYGAYPQLCMQLEIELSDGRRQTVATDSSWQSTIEGPIRLSDLLDGETYDARQEMPGWDKPGFQPETSSTKESWFPVIASPLDNDPKLVWQRNEPIRVIEELSPIKLTEPKPGVFVFDLGQNMVGWCRFKVQGPKETKITFRYAERLNTDGMVYMDNLRGAAQRDEYILRGVGEEFFEPHFTYHGFRYVEVTGLSTAPKQDDLLGRVFCSSAPKVGKFTCSNELLNQLMHNILWVQRGNLHGVPTDCPQRDERLGWMGDIQAFSQTAIFNMDMAAFFSKWIPDVRDAQSDEGRYPDYTPYPYPVTPNGLFMGTPAWADAGMVVPWRMYQNYADKRLLTEHYDSAKRWIDLVHEKNPNLLWLNERGENFGDWLNGDTVILEGYPQGISQVPHEVFATAFFAHSTEILGKMAEVLQKKEDTQKYKKLAGDIKAAFQREYVTPEGRIRGDTQAGYALALRFELLDDTLRPKAVSHLLEAIQKYKAHPSTGIQSTHRMLLELSKNGHHDEASRIVNLRTVPSWGYAIEMGATTIWERWDGYVEGRGFQSPGMNSFNHYALGSVGEWIWRDVVGIHPDESRPGFKHLTIRPRPDATCTSASGVYDSIRGRIESDWAVQGEHIRLKVTIPPNVTADVAVPSDQTEKITEGGKPAEQSPGVKFLTRENGATIYSVESGDYEFVAPVTTRH